jgi:hypothetical protein
MRSRKVKIHQFDPVIYPIKLWVVTKYNGDEGALKERFVHILDRKELNFSIIKQHEALTYDVEEREDKYKGVLIVFSSSKYCKVKTMAHESTHAARSIWDHLGEGSGIGEEANAYLVGWVADCIERVKLGKE